MKYLLALLAAATLSASAADYKILMLNTPTITIGGRQLSRGDTFSDRAVISWQSDRQAMKAMNTATLQQRLFVSADFERVKARTLGTYLSGRKHLSSRDGELSTPAALGTYLDDTFFFTDSITIQTAMPTDAQHFFYISYPYAGETINKLIPNRDGAFTVSADIFTIDGRPIPPFETDLAVYYLDQQAEKLTLITRRMRVVLVQFH